MSFRTGISQLMNQTFYEVEIRRDERVPQQHLADELVWMVEPDRCGASDHPGLGIALQRVRP